MNIIGIIVIVVGCGFIILAHYWFIMNTRRENYDVMGASISFDQPFLIGSVFLSIGLGLVGMLVWYWCIALIIVLAFAGLCYKWWVLERVVQLFRRSNTKKL